MKSFIKIIFIPLILVSCNKSVLEKEFSCNAQSFNASTETVIDVKKTFSIEIPMHWKTNLFYDKMQSSIYSADTTKQLSETILIDITHLQSNYRFNDHFKKQLTINDSIQKLTSKKQHSFLFKNRDAYFTLSNGKKGSFKYQILNIFVKQNNFNSFHLKTEVYGDSAINTRFCQAIQTLNSITFNAPQ